MSVNLSDLLVCEHGVYHQFITLSESEGILQAAAGGRGGGGGADGESQLCVNVI